MYDFNLARATLLTSLSDDLPDARRIVRFGSTSAGRQFLDRPQRVLALDDRTFLGTLVDSSGKTFAVFDSTGRVVRMKGQLRRPQDSVPDYLGGRPYTATLCHRAGMNRVALAFTKYGRIELFDLTGTRVGEAAVPFPSPFA